MWNRQSATGSGRGDTRKPCGLRVFHSFDPLTHTPCSNLIRRTGAIYFLVLLLLLTEALERAFEHKRKRQRDEILQNALFSLCSSALCDFQATGPIEWDFCAFEALRVLPLYAALLIMISLNSALRTCAQRREIGKAGISLLKVSSFRLCLKRFYFHNFIGFSYSENILINKK